MKVLLTFLLIVFLSGWILFRVFPRLLQWWIKSSQKQYHREARAPKPKKRIDKSVGEYVDFEEIDRV